MFNKPNTKVTLRHGIAEPVFLELESSELMYLTSLSAKAGIDYLLSKVPHANGFVPAFKETLLDPQAIVEIRQGDRVKVLTRRNYSDKGIIRHRADLPEIEVAVAKANRGG